MTTQDTDRSTGHNTNEIAEPRTQRLIITQQLLIDHFTREHATTTRVVRAFPESQFLFRPHARSATALDLLRTMTREQAGVASVLEGTWSMPPSFPSAPNDWAEGLAALDSGGERLIAALRSTPAARLDESVPFFTGAGQVGPMRVEDVLWFWLFDTIHHRGQLSVYTRMAGGRVPSIYGPSADEPWS